jgi:hypothetical protein
MSRDNYLERIAERVKEVREKPIDGAPERKHKWYMKNRDRILAQCKRDYERKKKQNEQR